MKIIYGKRRSGKTAEIIKQCSQDKHSLIVVPNSQMRDCVFLQSQEMGCSIPNPITFDDFINARFNGFKVEKFYFDELIMCIKKFTNGVPIEAVNLVSDEFFEKVILSEEKKQ